MTAKARQVDLFSAFSDFFSSPIFRLLTRLFVLFLIVFWLSLIYWTYRDAKRRGALAVYWAAVVLFFNIFGLFIYLIVRPPECMGDAKERELEIKRLEAALEKSDVVCSSCFKPIEPDFLVCPYCLKKLKESCPRCGHALKTSWTVCPYCRATLSKTTELRPKRSKTS